MISKTCELISVCLLFRPCFLLGAIFLFGSVTPSHSARMEPPLVGRWNAFPIVNETGAACVFEFVFATEDPASATKTVPRGLLYPICAPGDSFLSCSWQIAEPDRDDHFSVRWKGKWQPGNLLCEIRLRSDDEASFYLNGSEVLSCREAVAGVTGTFQLDARRHDLRVDFHEAKGNAFVHLEWREPERAWRSLVPEVPEKKEEKGWQATYYLGENFEKEVFARIDPVIDFDWKGRGPFDRSEDLPTAQLEWATLQGESLIGQVRSNRDGLFSLTVRKTSLAGDLPSKATVQSTHLVLEKVENGSKTLDLHFDHAASEFFVPNSTDNIPDSATGALTLMQFPLPAGESIRFWEKESGVQNGAGVAKKLDLARKGFDRSRPRLTGGLATWDEKTLVAGRFWCRALATCLEQGGVPTELDTLEKKRYLRPIVADLPVAVSSMVSIWAPDLFESLGSGLESLPLEWASRVFVDASTPELARLGEALSLWKRTFESNRTGRDKAPPVVPETQAYHSVISDPRWPIRTLSEGLTEALFGLAAVNGFVFPNPSGGIDVGNQWVQAGEYGIDNVRVGEKTYSFSISPNGLNLRCEDGFSLSANLPALFSGFHIGGREEWSADVVMRERGFLEVGPPKRIRGATWDGNPLLLTHRGQSLFSGKLPSERGTLTVTPAEKSVAIPLE
jgi:hypothetical protein